MNIVTRVGEFLENSGVGTGPLVVAVSGGPDSVALLLAAVAWLSDRVSRAQPEAGPIVVSHFNHQLRGAESDADEAFVIDLSNRLASESGIKVGMRQTRESLADHARELRTNVEGLARRMRYDWLVEVARETGAAFVATGHTADDQAETVLLRLLRGTGLKGLRGIAARRPLSAGVEVIRPLLTTTRSEILAYLSGRGQDYRLDSSNTCLDLTRNRVRHELLPHLAKQYNPAIAVVLARLAEQATEAYREEESRAAALLAEAELPRAGSLVVLKRDCLAAAPRHLVRAVFRLIWSREGWAEGDMGFGDWDRMARLASGEAVAVDLPAGVRVRSRGTVVQVGQVR